MLRTAHSVVDLIGNTPLVDLSALCPGPYSVLAKAEFLNPGGSVKDRTALAIIKSARASGLLAEGQTVVEMTSGNMGSGLAIACGHFGHPFIAFMSDGNSPVRAALMEAFGAKVVLVPQVDGSPGEVTGKDIEEAARVAKATAAEIGAYYVDQFHNEGSVIAHFEQTGPEIAAAAPDIAAFVASVGTGGTFVGVSRYLKAVKPDVLCAVVEPQGAAVLAGCAVTKPRHLLQGTGYGIVPSHFDRSLMDLTLTVTDEDALAWRRKLGEAGYYVGFSSAANVCAADRLGRWVGLRTGKAIVTMLCDTGLKY